MSMLSGQLQIRHGLTDRILAGGSKSLSFALKSLSRAPQDEKPKLRTNIRFTGDDIVTRSDHRGALNLGRLAKSQVKSGNTGPKTGVEPTPKSTVQPSSIIRSDTAMKPDAEKPSTKTILGKAETFVLKMADQLIAYHKAVQVSPSGDRKGDIRTEAETIQKQSVWRGEIDAELKGISKAVCEKQKEINRLEASPPPVDPGALRSLKSELRQLQQMRGDLVALAVGVEFPGIARASSEPLIKGGMMTALWTLHGPGANSLEAVLPGDQIKELGRVIDAFNDAEVPVLLADGSRIGYPEFAEILKDCMGWLAHCDNGPLADKAIAEFQKMLDVVDAKIGLHDIALKFGAILDEHPEFPVTGAMRSIGAALPNIRQDANSLDPARLLRGTDGIRTLAEMIRAGDTFPNMQGIDVTFDNACLPLKCDRGERDAIAHLKERFIEADIDFPSKELLALAGKDFAKLTIKEKADLIAFATGQGTAYFDKAYRCLNGASSGFSGVPTSEDALNLLGKIAQRPQEGRNAAELRHKLTQVNQNLADVLTADRRHFLKPWTWADKNVRVFSDGQSVLKDATLMKALTKFGDKNTGKDVAILLSKVAHLEIEAMRLEQDCFGLYPNLDVPSKQIDPKRPLEHFGISNKDLQSIGVNPDSLSGDFGVGDVTSSISIMSRQGVASIDHIQTAFKAINDISKIVLRSELSQGLIKHYEGESARALGQHLVNELIADADLSYRRTNNLADPSERPKITDKTVTEYFKQKVALLKSGFDTANPKSWDRLKSGADFYSKVESQLVRSYEDRNRFQDQIEDRRAFLKTEAEKLDLKLDPSSPQGLRSAKAILNALRDHELFETYGTEGPKQRRDDALKQLRGFDDVSMRRPWHAKVSAFFGVGKTPDIAGLKQLKEIAEAIVFLREDAPVRLSQITAEVEEYATVLDGVTQQRLSDNPKEIRGVIDMIRVAVLNEWRGSANKTDFSFKSGDIQEGFNPAISPNRDAIEKTLKSWGLDLERFKPELDHVLFSRMTPDDMILWAKEAQWSSDTIKDYESNNPTRFSQAGILQGLKTIAHEFTMDGLLHRKVMDADTKQSLLSMLGSFQDGDKLDLKAGQRITLDSGKIPVEPTGIAGIKAKLSGAHIGQMEVERGGDGFILHLRSGLEGKLSIDGVVGKKLKLAEGVELSGEAFAGLEGSGSRLTGVSINFPNDANGVNALVDLIGKMVDGDKITVWDLEQAKDIGASSEGRTKFGLNAGVTGRALVGAKAPKLGGVQDTLGIGIQGNAQIGIARGTKTNVSESLNQRTDKREVEYSVTLGAGISAYARLYNPLNIATGMVATQSGGQQSADSTFGMNSEGKSNYNISDNVSNMEIAGLGLSMTASYTDKWKEIRDVSGLFTKAEMVRQSNIRQGLIQAFAVCDTPELQQILTIKNPDKEKDKVEFAKNFSAFMSLASRGDFIQVTYSLKSTKLVEANDLMRRALVARRQGDDDRADAFEKLANAIIDDKANYRPAKIGLVATSVQKAEVTNINARFIKWDSFSDGKMEHTGATLQIP